jgi:hypothetical protein
MLIIAAVVAIGASVVGTLVSFHIDGATGPCIVLIQTFVFVLAFLFAPKRGVLARRPTTGVCSPSPDYLAAAGDSRRATSGLETAGPARHVLTSWGSRRPEPRRNA